MSSGALAILPPDLVLVAFLVSARRIMDMKPIDYVRGALANAIAEGLDLLDVYAMAEHARTCADFDDAVNELVQATCKTEQDIRDQHRDLFPK